MVDMLNRRSYIRNLLREVDAVLESWRISLWRSFCN